ncbi:MAG: alcohol dehydrogenase catalytic domain-containing protein [Phycisphaerales bacterium]|nr:MAG: alcohol dehydrogenase catalytic domain-containing protein [Phycisphaerales bacterium]
MKEAFLVGPRRFELRDVPEPSAPDDGLVLQVEACGVCGSDLRRWKEGPPKGVDGIVPGHEASGIVVEVGKHFQRYSVGDRLAVAPDVHCSRCYYCRRGLYNLCDDLRFLGITPGYPGGFAEKIVLTGEILADGIVHPMPQGLSFKEGALAEPCCSVLALHGKIGTSLADTVLVMGAGPIGCLHVVVAKERGASVIVSEPNETRRELAERFEPQAIVDPAKEDLRSVVFERTGSVGADIVVCANPIGQTQTQAVELVRKAGKIALFGGLPKANPMVSFDSNRIHYGEIEVIGAFSYHPTMHELALELLGRKVIPAELLITHSFSLNDTGKAFETADSGDALKVVVTT